MRRELNLTCGVFPELHQAVCVDMQTRRSVLLDWTDILSVVVFQVCRLVPIRLRRMQSPHIPRSTSQQQKANRVGLDV